MAAVLVDAIESGDLEAARIAYAALSLGSRSSVSEGVAAMLITRHA